MSGHHALYLVLLSVTLCLGASDYICQKVQWGTFTSAPWDNSNMANTIAFDNNAKRSSQIVHYFINWSDGYQGNNASAPNFGAWGDFPPWIAALQSYTSMSLNKHVPLITWQPWNPNDGATTSRYSFDSIVAGTWDSYITSFAKVMKSFNSIVYIRLAHEFDGNWYPWGLTQPNNSPAKFVAMWRYVVNRFRAANATNVRMVWCPNNSNSQGVYFETAYPGDAYVDWVCLDAYAYNTGVSFNDTVGSAAVPQYPYQRLTKLTSKPVMIAEFGADISQSSGGYTNWIAAMANALPSLPQIRAVVFFNVYGYAIPSSDTSSFAGVASAMGNCPTVVAPYDLSNGTTNRVSDAPTRSGAIALAAGVMLVVAAVMSSI